jgi:membrane protease YdiL (CAAX protease family)
MDTDLQPSVFTTLRRVLLIVMTVVVGIIMSGALITSWREPQVANRLELYQTDLLLQAIAWDGGDLPDEQAALLRKNLLGEDPLKDAQKNYESVRKTAVEALDAQESGISAASPRLAAALKEQAELLDALDLRLGILAAEQGNVEAAVTQWQAVKARQSNGSDLWQTADTLIQLWQDNQAPADTTALSKTLQGWFLYRAFAKAYTVTQQSDALADLAQEESAIANKTILTLATVSGFPAVGALLGSIILVLVGIQRLLKGRDSLLARYRETAWDTPWNAETIWLVMVAGFFFMGQLVVPLLISPLRGIFVAQGIRGQSLFALLYYGMMAAGTISVLFWAIRTYRPLPAGWFQFETKPTWLAWGLGGYLAALPLMLVVSLLNQKIWQGQGGSNPLLQTVLEAKDPIALSIFFITAAIAAPLFEEFIFRGFLLPSLTRYLPVWGAIALSSFVFAIAHLSLSEVLPLMVLGIILGIVYTRSRNLLAPMLLHSLWNGITMAGLFLLGRNVV